VNEARNHILEMLSSGRISSDEADRLLRALARRHSLWAWLFRPLEQLETRFAVLAAFVTALLQLAVALLLHVRFDGALDSHVTGARVAFTPAILDLAVAWPLTALVFFAVSRLFARQGRFVDLLAGVGIARLPLVAAGVITGSFRGVFLDAASGTVGPALVAVSLALVPLVVWFVALLVMGLRAASGLRAGKLALASVTAIVVAEVISKVLLGLGS